MLKTKDGYYIKNQLDLYWDNDGNPSIEDRQWQARADAHLIDPTKRQDKPGKQDMPGKQDKRSQTGKRGYSREELKERGFSPQMIELILQLLNSD